MVGGRREQEERLAEDVELKLLVHVVADDVESAGVTRHRQRPLIGHPPTTGRVRGGQRRAVDQETTDESEDGLVVGQDPSPGGQAGAGSSVTIYVGRFGG